MACFISSLHPPSLSPRPSIPSTDAPTCATPSSVLSRPSQIATIRRRAGTIAKAPRHCRAPTALAPPSWPTTRTALSSFTALAVPAPPSEAAPPPPGVRFEPPPHLTVQDLLDLVRQDSPDAWVNEMVRTLLGWRQLADPSSAPTAAADGDWDCTLVPAVWLEVYPDAPPDFIGSVDDFSPEKDRPVKKAVQKLTRSVPPEHKQLLKEVLAPHGFPGWKLPELTPNRTRRATVANWILHWYRSHYPEYEWI